MTQNDIQEFTLPNRDEIAQKMVLSRPTFAKPRGTVTVVKVWFLQESPYAAASGAEEQKLHASFSAVTAGHQSQIRALAMQPFQEVANVSFELATSMEEADIRVGLYSDAGGDGGITLSSGSKKDVFLNLKGATAPSLMPGSDDTLTFMHEFGHALGLNHPSVLERNPQGAFTDRYSSYRYSVESYNLYLDEFRWGRNLRPITPMLFDLAGLDSIYGLRSSNKGGNDTYNFTRLVIALIDHCFASDGATIHYNSILDVADLISLEQYKITMPIRYFETDKRATQ